MKEVKLYREPSTDHGTFGFLLCDGGYWHSLELPDRDNKRGISCIPGGEYICKKRYSPGFKRNTYHVQDVKGRTYILMHSANFAGDTEKGLQSHLNGCIALGKKRGQFPNKYGKTQRAILLSKKAMREFTDLMDWEEFKLIIKEI